MNVREDSFEFREIELSTFTISADREMTLLLGHGAGSNARSALQDELAHALFEVGLSTVRFNYPYSQQGRRRPDHANTLKSVVRDVAERTRATVSGRLFAGGHSMSGRMISMADAEAKLPIEGIVFFAFPLAGKATQRTPHLRDLDRPLLFVQGTRDRLTPIDEIQQIVDDLGSTAERCIVEGADHSFEMLKRSGRTRDDVLRDVARATSAWIDSIQGALE